MRVLGRLAAVAGFALAGCGSAPEAPSAPSELRFVAAGGDAGVVGAGPSYAAAAADADGDELPDLLISRHGTVPLLTNLGGGRFRSAESWPGVAADTHGLSWTDLDRDGWLDVVVSVGAARGYGEGPNELLHNLGGRGFSRQQDAPEVLADPRGRGRCTCPIDFDGDGTLDLMILNAPQADRPHRLALQRDGRWIDVAAETGLAEIAAECLAVVHAGLPGGPLLVAYGGGDDSGRFFQRSGSGRLVDVTDVVVSAPIPGGVMAVASGDIDGDGDIDVYLVRGTGVPRQVTTSDGRIDFRLIAERTGEGGELTFRTSGDLTLDAWIAGRRRPTMVALGAGRVHPAEIPTRLGGDDPVLAGRPDIDPARDRGLFVWRDGDGLVLRFVGDAGRFRAAAGSIESAAGLELLGTRDGGGPRPETPNILLENRGDVLTDVTARAGVGDAGSGRDAVLADLDNDGDLDLYVVNGGTAFANLPDVLYRNRGDGTFEDVTAAAGVAGPTEGRGASALAFDFDSDGDLDLFATNGDGPEPGNDGPWTLWRNETDSTGSWVEVELVGSPANAPAIGAVLRARFGDRLLAVQRTATTGRFSTSILPLHVGIGDARSVELEVIWPSGARSQLSARPGERVVVRE